jgi:hypothetical protein
MGIVSVALWATTTIGYFAGTELAQTSVAVGTIAGAPLLTVLACWLPGLAAIQQDPANILREE